MNFEKTNFDEMTGWICGKSEVWKLLNSGPPVHSMEKEMATHSSVLAWRIPGTGEPRGLLSMGSHRVGHDWSDLAAAAAAVHSNSIQRLVIIAFFFIQFSSVQFSSVTQSCLTLCDPMNRSMPGLPVHHRLPEFTQTHVHRVGVAIQPSHPLSSPFPPAPNPSQHQSLFQWVNSSHEVARVSALASVLPKNTQGWPPSEWTGWISLQSKGLSRVFSNTTVQKHQFFGAQLFSQSNSRIHTWPLEKP